MTLRQPPRPDKELLTWARKNRPDMVQYLEEIVSMGGARGDAFLLLICSSFSAGRWYQNQNPETDNLISRNPYED